MTNDNLPHAFNCSLYKIYKKNKHTTIHYPVPTYMEQQDRVLTINTGSGYFRFTEAVSSSFRTNFFLRASEIKVAESSSLRDVQPLLYLQWHPPKNTNQMLQKSLRVPEEQQLSNYALEGIQCTM